LHGGVERETEKGRGMIDMSKKVLKLHSLEILSSSGCSVQFLWLGSTNLMDFAIKMGFAINMGAS
jgi:hypothetical protein